MTAKTSPKKVYENVLSATGLKLSYSNRKIKNLGDRLDRPSFAFDLPAGHTCPGASLCKVTADRETGRQTWDKDSVLYKCYASNTESAFRSSRMLRWHNMDTLQNDLESFCRMVAMLPENAILRIHASGDFFNRRYFQTVVESAKTRPDVTIFGYTKVLPYVLADKPDNFHLVYSVGGIFDNHPLTDTVARAYVVNDESEASMRNLPTACNHSYNDTGDFEYIMEDKSFCLTIH